MTIIDKIRSSLFVVGVAYAGAVGLLAFVPWAQTHAIYLHALRFPFGADFAQPEKYGLAPNKTLNLKIQVTEESESEPHTLNLGAWFVLSDAYYHALPSLPAEPPTPEAVRVALQSYPTILFFHGNGATRAFHVRTKHYSMFTSRLKTNVLALDYRGYAESEGTPSEEGLGRDARAAWDWLTDHGATPQDILIVGHSLGTGVSANLLKSLESESISPRGCVLMSPFSSISEVLSSYHIFGFLPLMQPLHYVPFATDFIKNSLSHHYDTKSILPNTTTPILIAHARNDPDIPYHHSQNLFNALLDPYLPHLPVLPPLHSLTSQGSNGVSEEWEKFSKAVAHRSSLKQEIVRRTDIKGIGYIEEFYAPFPEPIPSPPPSSASVASDSAPPTPRAAAPPPPTPWTPHRVWDDMLDEGSIIGGDEASSVAAETTVKDGRMVRLVITENGSHDYVGLDEGLQDIIGRSFGLI